MQRCPSCSARLNQALCCPRCKADLREIIRVQRLAMYWYRKALDEYVHHESQSCVDSLTRSLQLRHNDSALLFRDFVMERQQLMVWTRLQYSISEAMAQSLTFVKSQLEILLKVANAIYYRHKRRL